GHLGIIIPNTWLLINSSVEFRKAILNTNIREIIDYGDGVFEEATVESLTLLIDNIRNQSSACRVVRKKNGKTIFDHVTNKEYWLQDEYHRIVIDVNVEAATVLKQLEMLSEEFEESSSIIWGIKPYQLG